MKKLLLLPIVIFMANSVQSQSYIPLTLDSLYAWSWYIDFEGGDTVSTETWSAFSYDANDSLAQRRSPGFRYDYTYAVDTTYLLVEALDINDQWNAINRSTTAYIDGLVISKLNESFSNSIWANRSLYTYSHNASGNDTLQLLQHWKEGMWTNFYKKEKTFDNNGNCLEESEYYANENDEFVFNRGKLFEYNQVSKRIQEIGVNTSINGPYYTTRINWIYNNDALLDTLMRCDYKYPNDGTCNNAFLATYVYDDQDFVAENSFRWVDDQWKYIGKELTYKGPGIYSSRPDSAITFYYRVDSFDHKANRRKYLQYQDLGNDTIYFKEMEYNLFTPFNEWKLTDLKEEWYHIKGLVSASDLANPQELFSFYPNPCKVGQNLTLENTKRSNTTLEILVFDINGQLISTHDSGSQSSFQAPNHQGVFSLLIRENNRLIGTSKLIIVE